MCKFIIYVIKKLVRLIKAGAKNSETSLKKIHKEKCGKKSKDIKNTFLAFRVLIFNIFGIPSGLNNGLKFLYFYLKSKRSYF